jgi:hypothetical protein
MVCSGFIDSDRHHRAFGSEEQTTRKSCQPLPLRECATCGGCRCSRSGSKRRENHASHSRSGSKQVMVCSGFVDSDRRHAASALRSKPRENHASHSRSGSKQVMVCSGFVDSDRRHAAFGSEEQTTRKSCQPLPLRECAMRNVCQPLPLRECATSHVAVAMDAGSRDRPRGASVSEDEGTRLLPPHPRLFSVGTASTARPCARASTS